MLRGSDGSSGLRLVKVHYKTRRQSQAQKCAARKMGQAWKADIEAVQLTTGSQSPLEVTRSFFGEMHYKGRICIGNFACDENLSINDDYDCGLRSQVNSHPSL